MGARAEMATIAKLQRAAAIGAELERIEGDVTLQRLTKAAWLAKCTELAGGVDLAELRERIASTLPYLASLIERTARRHIGDGVAEPVEDGIFGDGHNELAAYAERLAAGITTQAAAGAVGLRIAELLSDAYWGKLTDFVERQALLDPLRAELEALDASLERELRVADVSWAPAGATLRAGAVVAVLDATTAARPASALALAARNAARGIALAA